MKQKLDEELSHLTFSRQEEVLKRVHPLTWREKVTAFLNREVTIPLVPLMSIVFLVVGIGIGSVWYGDPDRESIHHEERVLIEKGGNMYWSDLFKERVNEK